MCLANWCDFKLPRNSVVVVEGRLTVPETDTGGVG